MVRGKGLEIVLKALEGLPEEVFRLDVVGSCDREPGYASQMRRLALRYGSSVKFRGKLEGAALSALLQQAHALVLPSYYEGFGIA